MTSGDPHSAPLELRLLAGVHAGATVSLAPGQSITIGSSRSCDVVLRDAPFAEARLEAAPEGWLWFEPDGTRQALKSGYALSAGALLLTVQQSGADWMRAADTPVGWTRPVFDHEGAVAAQQPEPLAVSPQPDAAATIELQPEGGASQADDDSRAPGEPIQTGPARQWRERLTGTRGWWLAPGAVLVALAWFAGGTVIDPLIRALSAPPAAVQTAQQPETRPSATADDLARVIERLKEGGFHEVARASLRADGRIEVAGVLENIDEQDQLVQWLSPERRWLALSLITQSEFAERVRAAAKLLPEGFEAAAMPGGRVVLTGLAVHPDEPLRALSVLEQNLPQTGELVTNLLSPDDVAAQLNRDVRALGLASVKVAWVDSKITVDGAIPRERSATWEQMLLGFNRRYGERLPARVALSLTDPPPPTASPAPILASASSPLKLPRIVAVQSGALSYLLFADGHRVLPGGIINGYRLAAISDTELVFEDAAGTQHRIPR